MEKEGQKNQKSSEWGSYSNDNSIKENETLYSRLTSSLGESSWKKRKSHSSEEIQKFGQSGASESSQSATSTRDDLKNDKNQKCKLSEVQYFPILFIFLTMVLGVVKKTADSMPSVPAGVGYSTSKFSEVFAREHLENILAFGFRPAGSLANEKMFPDYVKKQVQTMVKHLGQDPIQSQIIPEKNCVGSFGLDFLDGFASSYAGLTNTLVRLSSPKHHVSENTLLVNCHTDSSVGALGASDDAVACAIMLEVIRVLLSTRQPLRAPVLFLFNGAEENILQASHAFVTQSPLAKDVKAFINLEAAGAGGKEIVFQTGPNSPWLARAWAKHAPHPYGSVFAEELFQSGVIPSDTDFRIFRDFGKIPGVDLAYARNGYVYHTEYDNAEMINPGSIQRAGENILSVVRALTMDENSYLHDSDKYQHGSVAFFDLLGLAMVVVPSRILFVFNWATYFAVISYFGRKLYHVGPVNRNQLASTVQGHQSGLKFGIQLSRAIFSILLSLLASFLAPALLASLLTLLRFTQGFFSDWRLAVCIYLPFSFAAYVSTLRYFYRTFHTMRVWAIEELYRDAIIAIWTSVMALMTVKQLHSSIFFAMILLPSLLRKAFDFFVGNNRIVSSSPMSLMRSLALQLSLNLVPILILMQHSHMLMEFFVPLTGRMGTQAPPDLVVALLVAINALPVFVCLSDTLHYVRDFRRFYNVVKAVTIMMIVASTAGCLFPYKVNKSTVTPMRLIAQHTHRQFYTANGAMKRSDSGILVNCLDYTCPSVKTGYSPLDSQPHHNTEAGLFSHWPWYAPFDKKVKKQRYIATLRPPTTSRVSARPLAVRVRRKRVDLVARNETHRELSFRLSLSITGPSHLSLHVGPFESKHGRATLNTWSISADPRHVSRTPTNRKSELEGFEFTEWFFVYHYGGLEPDPWHVELELRVVVPEGDENETSEWSHPTLEVGAASHYLPHAAGDCGGHELNAMRASLKKWVTLTCWHSHYHNYIF